MATPEDKIVEALRTSLKESDRLRELNRRLEDAAGEPIAIVGMSCRYPGGVRSPEDLWQLVSTGGDAVTGFPSTRGWDLDGLYHPDPDEPGTCYTREGGFLHDADHFDPGFFGISPRDALAIDPQQRLLLETSFEAFERAGISLDSVRGSKTGVFTGVMYNDYAGRMYQVPAGFEGLLGNGSAGSVASGRIAYTYGFEGPAVTIDTACSSSLVALHLAAQALRQGDCSLALAGGVAVMATPSALVEFSRQRALAPDGRCKPFAAAADGTSWAEGAGLLLVERLSDARRNGHPVLAVLRGSAVNQDGASNGMTAPNGLAQQRVIRQALANAGLAPSDVDAVEAHGTGTTLGDPIEAEALLATYGRERERPLWLGSLKSNIGHTQAAAGVGGVIKMVMAMRHGVLPRTLHVDEPSSHVDWSAGDVELLTEARPWRSEVRRAGVSSFGVSGTNAHVIIESPVEEPAAPGISLPVVPWVLSAKSEPALRARAGQLRSLLDGDLTEIGFSLATAPMTFTHRAVVVAEDRAGIESGLDALTVRGVAQPGRRVVFVFPGQGSQWAGMAVDLLGSSPVFAERMAECAAALEPFADFSLLDVLGDAGALERVDVVQPVLFAVMVSLAAVWRSFGVEPAAVVGHSQGEIAAAVVAGGLSLEDGARVVALRSRAILALAGQGGMVSLAVSVERARELLSERVSVAAVNGPSSVVVSGDVEALDELVARCEAEGVRAKRVPVDYASHSVHVELIEQELREVLAPIEPKSGTVPFYSTVTGELLDTVELDAGYWYRNLRQTVRFEEVVAGFADAVFVECSAHPVLTVGIEESVDQTGGSGTALGTLRRDEGGFERLLTSLGEAFVQGVDVDWSVLFTGARRVDLPTYPFQREPFWLDAPAASGDVTSAGLGSADHPLLGAVVALADGDGFLFAGRLSVRSHPWLADHVVRDAVLLPGTALLELAGRAAQEVGCRAVEDLVLEAPLVLPDDGGLEVQVAVGAANETGRRPVSVHSRPQDQGFEREWTRHAAGTLGNDVPEPADLRVWPPENAEPIDVSGLYEDFAERGFAYGPAFQGLRAAWRRGDEIFAEVSLPSGVTAEAARFGIHPALLDAALHAAALSRSADDGRGMLPFAWSGAAVRTVGASALRVRLTPAGTDAVSLQIADSAGTNIASVTSLVLRPVAAQQLPGDSLFRLEWTPTAETSTASVTITVLGEDHLGLTESLAAMTDVPDLVFAPLRPETVRDATGQASALVREWLADERFASARLVVVTSGAMADEPDLAAAAVWGLLRSVQAEHPDRFVLAETDNALVDTLLPVLAAGEESQVVSRGGEVLVPRLVRARTTDEAPAFDVGGTVLITGGTGMLGGLLARHLVTAYGARHLLLTSRNGQAPELVTELTELGAQVTVAACDVADRDQLAAVLAAIPASRPLTAVVHAAGALADGLAETLTPQDFETVLRPKVDGALNLHELTLAANPETFVLFSSATGTLGGAGQANYSAANAVLDALARLRQARGLAGQSLAWGLWAKTSGMTADADIRRMSRNGLTALSDEQGLALFDTALAMPDAVVLPVTLNLASIRAQLGGGAVPPILRSLIRTAARRVSLGDNGSLNLVGMSDAERDNVLLELVRAQVAAVLGHATASEVDTGLAFKDLGFDSLTAVDLRNRLTAATGLRLPAALVFDHPTPVALAAYLRTALAGSETPLPATVSAGQSDEPIAIVGMSCRFPGGVASPDDLWRLVSEGGDAISAFPDDRGWDIAGLYDPVPQRPGKTYVREGGFLTAAADFDPAFFGISPREALAMDPQQRLLLESAWEVFEHAGIDPASVRGSRTGVFAGMMYHDYGARMSSAPEDVDGFLGVGNSGSVLSGRIAYTFGLEGPAVTVDTACSSSLVALHLAVQALRQGECTMALAGGVTVMATPGTFVEFSRARGLSPDGRCKAFSADADGAGWAEGVGLLLVERLSDAQRNGHQVLAVVRGSAVNQDGASNGLTAPNGPSQQRVIRQALANAGLEPSDVDVVEAHGTGTSLGDPIEADALLATYGQIREHPLWLGSVKSNIGHAQAAAGVAGVIKMVQALRHAELPRTLHADEPTPHVDWASGAVRLLSEAVAWPETGRPRRAGVSSFGISGTNAHTILEQAPETVAPAERAPELPAVPWVLSAKTEDALRAQASRLLSVAGDPADVGFSLATTRSGLEHRAVVVGRDRERLTAGLAAVAGGEVVSGVVRGVAQPGQRVVFVFPGQGSQWAGMAVELLDSSPVFAERMADCAAALEPFVDFSLLDVLREAGELERVDVVQPVLFAVMVSLAAVWRSFGVEPSAVVGHSQGEIAAAVVAGGLSLEDGARVVALRSKAILALSGKGGMVSLAVPAERARELLSEGISVASINGPGSVVVSGDVVALDALLVRCAAEGVRAKRIAVDYASHSAQVGLIEQELAEVLAPIRPRTAAVPFYSTVTGDLLDTAALDAGYWYRNLRQTVEFDTVIGKLEGAVFIECSPHPVLTMGIEERSATTVGTLRRGDGGLERLLTSMAEVFVHGVPVDWAPLFTGASRVDLPTYAFQHRRFWPSDPVVPEQLGAGDGDSTFWDAVEQQDLTVLTDTLQAGEHRDALGSVLPMLSSWRRRRREQSTMESWRYRVSWKRQPEPGPARISGTWLLLVPAESSEWTVAAEAALSEHGAQVVRVMLTAGLDRSAAADEIRAAGASEYAGLLSLLALDSSRHPEFSAVPAALGGTVIAVQALGDLGIDAPLWLCTRGAMSTGPSDLLDDPTQALVWGLGPVVGQEHPQRWGGLIDLPRTADEQASDRLCGLLAGAGEEDQLAIRASGSYARRLAHAVAETEPSQDGWRPKGTVLVTGGTGALGAHVARWLARSGAEHVLLASRRGTAAPGAEGLVTELAGLGAEVTVSTCDLADRAELAALLGSIPPERPLTAVVHTAAVLDDALLDSLSVEQIDHVLRVKVEAAINLHELTKDLDLSAFVLFSSFGGMFGAAGQGNYAPGNAFVDALAQRRRADGLPATAVVWGHWAAGGMAQGAVEERMFQRGVPAMAPDLAIAALQRVLDHDETSAVVVDIDWARVVSVSGRPSPLFRDIPEVRRLVAEADPGEARTGADSARSLATASDGERARLLLDVVRAQIAAVLGYDSAGLVDSARAFKELGFDSVTAVELRNRLGAATGLKLPATLVFDYPSPEALARYLAGELSGDTDVASRPVAARAAVDEPIAIVAMSCRFPGDVGTPDDLWRMLDEGGDGVSAFPADRGWDVERLFHPDPDQSGKTYVRAGGFLNDVAEFDAAFFGISPREALAMDPQQRLLLETSWEAFEWAGITPGSLRGSQTGVFVGASSSAYGSGLTDAPEGTEGHLLTGTAMSVVAGRLAYTFGTEGPAVTIDTACSSSLVALHLACQSLRAGECSLALTGGVTVMASPAPFVLFSRQRGLAADGRCKPFSAAADGMGMAEGAGILVLERLSDARRNGHRVLAVVRGSAVNQDGASNGLTAPNGPSQQRVILQALANAGLEPSDVDAVEAHGTGTSLGDPIEAQAVLATYGQGRDRPLWLGSVKSNIGHTQAASGVAGVIKMVLAMRHDVLPRTLHVDEPSPHVDWASGAVELLTDARPWPETGEPRRAGVSSFGVSGTNAHVILEQDLPRIPAPVPVTAELPAVPWVLSGRTPAALRDQAATLASHVDSRPDLSVADLGLSLVTTRSAFEHRAVVVGRDRDELLANLEAMTESGAAGAPGKVVFVFPGQGSQWTGMAVRLLDSSPVFAARMAECAAALAPFTDWSLLDVLRDGSELDRVDVIQPALFAILVSLAEVWRSLGIHPDAVVGHSQGEIAAACVVGALSLEDAARVVALRSLALPELSGKGGMVSVSLPVADVTAKLTAGLSVAAVNGPSSVVVSGDADAVTEFLAECEAEGVRARRIPVDYASHSAHVEQLEGHLVTALAPIVPRTSEVPFYSTVTGGLIDTAGLDAGYWYRNLRQMVEFERTTEVLVGDGHGVFVECSPHPVLTMAIDETADVVTVGTLRRGDGGMDRVLTSAGEAYVRGVRVDWAGVFAGSGARQVDLPAYAFQHKRFWLDFQFAQPAESTLQDVEFWDAVEREDLESLSGTLSVDGESMATVLPALSRWRRRQRDESVVDGWRYHVSWEPLAEPAVPESPGRWLVVAPAGQARHDWLLACSDALPESSSLLLESEVDRGELTARLRGIRVDGVLSLLGLDEGELQPGVTSGLVSSLVLMQALGDAEVVAPLWCATTGAVAAEKDKALSSPIQSQIWGLGRVVGLEQPRRWGGLIDLPETPDARAVSRLLGALAGTGEDQVAIRAAGMFGRRLVRAPSRRVSGPHKEWKPRGTVLVTGATGALGPVIARWLAGNGAEHLVLTSRRGGAANGMAELVAELAETGTRVTVAACDVADREALSTLVGKVEADGSVIRAVIHAAALIRLVPLAETTVGEFAEVVAAKVAGAAHLDELFAGRVLDAFVLFSSIAGVWGSGDHGAYAAAAAYLDALAERRRARGEVATSVAWGVWDAVHVLDNGDVVEDLMELNPEWHGLSPMDPGLGMSSLQYALDLDETFVAVADVDWERFTAAFTSSRPSPLIGGLPEVRRILDAEAVSDETVTGVRDALRERLLLLGNAERHRVVLDLVRANASSVLGHASADEVDPAQAFQEQGFDSLTAVDLRNRLTAATGLRLPATLVFDHPNAAALAGRVVDELFPDSASESGLDELDKLEAALADSAVDDATRTEITLRLKSLLSQWIDGGEPAGGQRRRDLGSATDDELFGVLDELRTS